MLFAAAFSLNAGAAIRVGYPEGPERVESGLRVKPAQFVREFFEALSPAFTGEVERVAIPSDRASAFGKLAAGEVDMLALVPRDEVFARDFEFSKYPMLYSRGLIMSRNVDNRFTLGECSNWVNVRVGILRGSPWLKPLRRFAIAHEVELKVVFFDDEASLKQALSDREIDLVVFSSLVSNTDLRTIFEFEPMPLHACIRKDAAGVKAALDAAMAAKSAENPSWCAELSDRYKQHNEVVIYLPSTYEQDSRHYGYLRCLGEFMGWVGGWKPKFKSCAPDFSDIDFSAPCILANVPMTRESLVKYDFPSVSIGRRFSVLLANPATGRFENGVRNLDREVTVGYVQGERGLLNRFRDYADRFAVPYRLRAFTDSAEMRWAVLTDEIDLAVSDSAVDDRMQEIDYCGYIDLYFVAPRGNPDGAAANLEMALSHLRYHEGETLRQIEHSFFGAVEQRRPVVCVGASLEPQWLEISQTGEATGMLAEYYERIARLCDWDLVYVPMPFSFAQEGLEQGEIDIVGGIPNNTEGDFLRSNDDIGLHCFALKVLAKSRFRANHPEGWTGARVGYLAGSSMFGRLEEYFRQLGAKCQFVACHDLVSAERRVRSGDLDACLSLHRPSSDDLRTIATFNTDLLYFGINPNRPFVKKGVDAALGAIKREEEAFEFRVKGRYFPDSLSTITLSSNEVAYVQQMQNVKIKIGLPQSIEPISHFDPETGEAHGFMPMLFEHISEQTGLEFEYCGEDEADLYLTQRCWIGDTDEYIVMRDWFSLPTVEVRRRDGRFPAAAKGVVAIERVHSSEIDYVARKGLQPLVVLNRDDAYRAVLEGRAEFTYDNIGTARILLDNKSEYKPLHYLTINTSVYARKVALVASTACNPVLLSILTKGCNSVNQEESIKMIFECVYQRRARYFTGDEILRLGAIATIAVLLLITLILLFTIRRIRREQREALAARLDRDSEIRLRETVSAQKIELEQQHEQLKQALEKSDCANRSKTVFLNNVSHDIRTPMNAIIGFTQLAEKHLGKTEQVRGYLGKITLASNHLLALLNEVLDMSRIESGTVKIDEQPNDLCALLRELKDIVAADASAKRHTLSIDCGGLAALNVRCDRMRMMQVMLNLVSNAIKYTPAGGRIEVKSAWRAPVAGEERGIFELTVKDNGIGMSEEFVKTVFEPFTREQSSTLSGVEGTGLGMAITKRIIESFGGEITVNSRRGEGSEFKVTVALVPVAAAAPAADRAARASANAPVAEKRGKSAAPRRLVKSLLLVEDNAINREIAGEVLRELGCEVDFAENGAIAVEKLAGGKSAGYEMILMDIQMPVMDGYEATRRIRAAGVTLPIVAMTANAFAEDRAQALEAGMDDHIAKPVKVEILKEVLARYARKQ